MPVKVGRENGRSPEGVYDVRGNVAEWSFGNPTIPRDDERYHKDFVGESFNRDAGAGIGDSNRGTSGIGFRVVFTSPDTSH